ncbi:MAG: hypothetical protein IKG23_07915 [Clostridia bacterium]|nr:hypothetical protein [Clostridia bacterium]
MMRNDYLDHVIRRGNELSLLDQAAALCLPRRTDAVRWAVAAAFGLLVTLLPSVCAAQAFFQNI